MDYFFGAILTIISFAVAILLTYIISKKVDLKYYDLILILSVVFSFSVINYPLEKKESYILVKEGKDNFVLEKKCLTYFSLKICKTQKHKLVSPKVSK